MCSDNRSEPMTFRADGGTVCALEVRIFRGYCTTMTAVLQLLEFRTQIGWKAKLTTIILIVAMYIYTLFVLL